MISELTAERVLAAALERGGDFAELFLEDKRLTSLSMYGGVVEDALTSTEHGAGVRVLRGDFCVYVYTNDTSEIGLIDCAGKAASALNERRQAGPLGFAPTGYKTSAMILPGGVAMREKAGVMKLAHAAAAECAELTQIVVGYADAWQNVLIANTQGVFVRDERVRTRLMVNCIAGSEQRQTGYEAPGHAMGFEVFRTRIDPEAVARAAAHTAVTTLRAPDCPGGFFPVVIDGGFGGVIFHEACGHALESAMVSKNDSVFAGMLGRQIAADCVSAADDGSLAGEWGSAGVDDEGMPTRRNLLIENGVLESYLVDIIGSRRMNCERTGSGRRQGYAFAPTSRMSNTFILPGEDDEDEMLRTMGEGLYAKKMGGGSVNPLTGEFNFAVTEGYWVKDGKIDRPVRGGTLIGKGKDVLMGIDRVGRTMTMAAGMCGSSSGSVPANVGQPRIRVKGMTVGGK